MLEASVRDLKVKGRTLRNVGLCTGTLKKKSGKIVPISLVSHKLETYLGRHGLKSNIEISLNGEKVISKIDKVQKDVVVHNVINIDLLEV